MKNELVLAFNEITERFGLAADTVMEALEAALVSAYRRSVNASTAQSVEAKIDLEDGSVHIFAEKEVVESVENPLTEVSLDEARAAVPEAQLGETVVVEATPKDFGRVAAQTAKQVILQRLREAERDAQYDEFVDREGELVHGTVHSITAQTVTVGLGRAEAILPRNQQIPGEHFRVRDRIRVYVLEVRKSSRGPVIVVSRTHPNMLRRLLEMEVPEISQGMVEIKAIAREAGKRAKVAVTALRDGVDPVGACVGLRGVRIQSIVRDLNDEKIDVIEWNAAPSAFIAKALSPARVSGVFLDESLDRGKTAMVVVPEDQLSLAIGRAGVNARLAARLTGWRIDIKSLPEAASESLHLLQSEAAFADLLAQESEGIPLVEVVLAKKAEERPVTPEEYQLLSSFVDRVQRDVHGRWQAEREARAEKLAQIRDRIPSYMYRIPLEEAGLSARVFNLLSGAGFTSAGSVMEDLLVNEDRILGMQGVGPKAVQEMNAVLGELAQHPPEGMEVELVPAEEAPAEAPAIPQEAVEAPIVAEVPAEVGIEAAAGEAAVVAQEEAALAVPGTEPEAVPVAAEEELPAALELPAQVEPADTMQVAEPAIDLEQVLAEAEVEEPEVELELLPTKKSKKRRQVARTVEYDPELGETIVKRRRKRGAAEEWEDV